MRLSKEYAELTGVVEAINELRRAEAEYEDLETLAADPEADGDVRALAREELVEMADTLAEKERRMRLMLLPKDEADERNAILEIRAGTGGDEAALFGADLFRMYQRYAESRGWKFEVMSVHETGIGGYKEAIGGDLGTRRIRAPEVRIGRAPGAARARDRIERTHSHLRRHRRRAAGSRGGGRQDRGQGPAHRRLPLQRPGRTVASTPPTAPFVSPTCRRVWWLPSRTKSRNTRTGPRP